MFGRATIRLGIGPHSSFFSFFVSLLLFSLLYYSFYLLVLVCRSILCIYVLVLCLHTNKDIYFQVVHFQHLLSEFV